MFSMPLRLVCPVCGEAHALEVRDSPALADPDPILRRYPRAYVWCATCDSSFEPGVRPILLRQLGVPLWPDIEEA
ncbi:protein of unknown function [Candidatus Hydrogenisulfobacillus filiaventi]|uniref:Uncharacterized protein n=1 Tax=Candidatus Hydrogenisulfobacillus filiaventi TaxID=2707344 RepID=A0A6F8ZIT7_9FIRM|nr:protein of unknown function [Candidatus Hydrogenisulfobacillus filiaventi]